jgi:hypothetical protein
MLIRKSNAWAAIFVLVSLAILFISFYVMLKPFSMVYSTFENDSVIMGDSRASALFTKVRFYWLLSPIVLAIGLLIWLISIATKQDPQTFQ